MVIAVVWSGEDFGDTESEVLAYYADRGNRVAEIAAFFLITVATLFYLWFASTLRDRLRAVEDKPGGLSALAFGAGVASAVLLVAAVAIGTAISFTIEDYDAFAVDPNFALALGDVSYLLLVGAGMTASVLVAATSVLAIRTPVLPGWFGWAGIVVAIALLVSIFFFPFLLYLLWLLVLSVLMLARVPAGRNSEQGALGGD